MEAQNLDLLTPYKRRKLEKEMAIYNEKKRLMAEPGAMAMKVYDILMEKFEVGSVGTLISICKRAEKRLQQTHQNGNKQQSCGLR